MLKKFIVLGLALSTLFMSTLSSAQPADLAKIRKESAIETAATTYLREAAYSQYYYTPNDLQSHTIESLEQSKAAALESVAAKYASFRKSDRSMLYENKALDSGRVDALLSNLKLHRDTVAYYAHLNELCNVTYRYVEPLYAAEEIKTDGDIASVLINELVDFQYTELDDTSMLLTSYCVSLARMDGKWLIIAVESDDDFYRQYSQTGVDLDRVLEGIDAAHALNEEIIEEEAAPVDDSEKELPDRATNNRPYNKQNAVNYALTYSMTNFDLRTPSFRNPNFYYSQEDEPNDCVRFVSQCLWAGFGGSNTKADIDNKLTMNTTGDSRYRWYGTSTSAEGHAWISTIKFKEHIENVNNGTLSDGIYCRVKDVDYNSDVLTGGEISQSDLLGAALLVKGGAGELRHAIILTQVSGSMRNQVYFSAYNKCAKNVLLSTKFPSDSTDPNTKIKVMAPRYLRNGNVPSGTYLYGELKNTLIKGASVTVKGFASESVPTLRLYVYAPSGQNAQYTFGAHVTNQVSGRVTFNEAGFWRVVVSAPGIASNTYTIRVANDNG